MGETLHAIVEVKPLLHGHWYEYGEWHFGKNYKLMCSLEGAAIHRGWPRDIDLFTLTRHELDDETRQWCTAEVFERLPTEREHSGAVEALLAAVKVLRGRGHQVRLLWYRK